MKTSYTTAIALAIATLAAGQVFAADVAPASKTREQVRAELFEARRTGDMLADGALAISVGGVPGSKLNAVFPNRYPAQPAVAGKTRDEVRAEFAEAQRTGDMLADEPLILAYGGQPGAKLNELFPSRYPVKSRVNQPAQNIAQR